MQFSQELRNTKRTLSKSHLGHAGVVAVMAGEKVTGGVRTGRKCVVVGVVEKKSLADLHASQVVPSSLDGVETDVVEVGTIRALSAGDDRERMRQGELFDALHRQRERGMQAVPPYGSHHFVPHAPAVQELTRRTRPVPGGYSIGHPQATAGTFGCEVGVEGEDPERRFVLTNSHVGAASGDASFGDELLQPGIYDQGRPGVDRIGSLYRWARIEFESTRIATPFKAQSQARKGKGNTPRTARSKPDPKPQVSQAFCDWLFERRESWFWGFLYSLLGCTPPPPSPPPPDPPPPGEGGEVPQPYPNRIDAALCLADEGMLDPAGIHGIGVLDGFTDLALNQRVLKTGRTTELTRGVVSGLDADVQVDYGPGKGVAVYAGQVVIRGEGGAAFSRPGDSGSAIIAHNDDPEIVLAGGLLFAGSDTITIACAMSDVIAILGVKV